MLVADPEEAGRRATEQARASLGDRPPSFAVLFASAHFLGRAEALVAAVAREAGPLPLIGCVAEAVTGGAREVESEPAVSLWLAADVGPVETFAMEFVRTGSGPASRATAATRFSARPRKWADANSTANEGDWSPSDARASPAARRPASSASAASTRAAPACTGPDYVAMRHLTGLQASRSGPLFTILPAEPSS